MQARRQDELLNFKQEGFIFQAGNRRKVKWYSGTPTKGRWIKDTAYFEYGTEENTSTIVMNQLSRFL